MRKPLKKFAEYQEKVLKQNDHKVGWGHTCFQYLLERLNVERQELENLFDMPIVKNDFKSKTLDDKQIRLIKEMIQKECADVANFAMMIYDNIDNFDKKHKKIENLIKQARIDLYPKLEKGYQNKLR